MKKLVVFVLLISMLFVISDISVAAWKPLDPEEPLTFAEQSGWGLDGLTASSQEVVDYCIKVANLSNGRIRYVVAGYTAMGKPIPMLVMGNPAPKDRAEKESRGLSSVFINCNIHSGEVEGKEAALIFARECALGRYDELLSKIVVLLIPNMNADGNDFLGTWRSGTDGTGGSQPLGPKLHGTRYNSQGLNINRDFSKIEAVESRVIYRLFNEWNPVLYLDAHATNGTRLRHTQTYSWGLNPNTDKALLEYNRTTFIENTFGPNSPMGRLLGSADMQMGGVTITLEPTAIPYGGSFSGNTARVEPDPLNPTTHVIISADLAGEFVAYPTANNPGVSDAIQNGDTITWATYGDLPRHTTNLAAMGNRLALLLEAYSYAPYRYRVETQYFSIVGAIEAVANDIVNINAMIKAADDRSYSWKTAGLPDIDISLHGGNPVRYDPSVDGEVGAYGAEDGIREVDSFVVSIPINSTGRYSIAAANFDYSRPITYRMVERQRYVTFQTAKMGALYIFESGAIEAAKLLQRHGITVYRLKENVEIPDHYRFRFASVTAGARYEGHYPNGSSSGGGYQSTSNVSGDWQHASTATVALWTPYREGGSNSINSNNRINAGSYVVSTAQPRGVIAAMLLEPRNNDGLFFWNYFDHFFTNERANIPAITPIIKVNTYNAGGAIPDSVLEVVETVAPEWPTDQPDDIGTIPENVAGNLPASVEAGKSGYYIVNEDEADAIISAGGGSHKEDNQKFYLDNPLAFANSRLPDAGAQNAVSLPMFKYYVTSDGGVGATTLLGVNGSSFFASKAEDVKLMALTNTGSAELLSIVYDPKDLADGKFLISTAEGYILQAGDPIPEYLKFDVTIALKDGGKFDLVSEPLAIGSTLVFIKTAEPVPPVKPGTGGSGCASLPIIPAILLFALVSFAIKKRK